MEFVQGAGFVLDGEDRVSVETPYAEEDLPGVRYAQLGDVVYFVHTGHAVHKLARTSHTEWTFEEVDFGSSIDAPTGVAGTWRGDGWHVRATVRCHSGFRCWRRVVAFVHPDHRQREAPRRMGCREQRGPVVERRHRSRTVQYLQRHGRIFRVGWNLGRAGVAGLQL